MLFSKPSPVDWIAVFLGNPGPKYAMTRHNAGFLTAEAFERDHGVTIDRAKFHALTAVYELEGVKILLMKPQTFMNLSGDAVSEAMRFYKIPLERVAVVSDDVHIPIGKLRVRRSGSAGGHNGLKDIIAKCGGENFPRVRVGVGAVPPDWDLIDWVLSVFRNQDAEDIVVSAQRAAKALECLILHGPDEAMNKFNG